MKQHSWGRGRGGCLVLFFTKKPSVSKQYLPYNRKDDIISVNTAETFDKI
jgi:hypothetical protein